MLPDDVLDVALVASLRPAALVVPPRHVLRLVRALDAPARAQPIDLAALAAHEGHEDAVAATDERDKRREVELLVDRQRVVDRICDAERAPESVEARGEHGGAARAVAVELVVEPRRDPLEVALQRLAAVAAQLVLARVEDPLPFGEQGVDPRL